MKIHPSTFYKILFVVRMIEIADDDTLRSAGMREFIVAAAFVVSAAVVLLVALASV